MSGHEEDGYGIRTVQSPTCGMGHKDKRTTMVYPAGAGLSRGGRGVRSLADGLWAGQCVLCGTAQHVATRDSFAPEPFLPM